MPLPAGILREKVVVEAPSETRNDLGETVQAWSAVCERWASVEAVTYSESQRQQQIGGSISHTVRLRYVPGLTGKHRLRWASRGDRLLYVSAVVEKGNREEHELTCEEQAT